MEIKEIIKLVKTKTKIIFLVSLLFTVFGVGMYYGIPPKQTATGSFFIKRTVEEPSPEFFSYEGYYAQQAALSYSNTLSALFESVDIRSKALKSLDIPVNDKTLRKYGRQIKVKNVGPQVVTLTIKGDNTAQVVNFWAALSNSVLETTKALNQEGDKSITVTPLISEPIVQMTFSNVYANAIAGALFGFLVAVVSLSFASYLREGE